jgi:uncharacterized protein (DUF1778 family)
MADLISDSATTDFDALADGRVFRLNDAQWSAFVAALDAPVADNPPLRALLASKPAWER